MDSSFSINNKYSLLKHSSWPILFLSLTGLNLPQKHRKVRGGGTQMNYLSGGTCCPSLTHSPLMERLLLIPLLCLAKYVLYQKPVRPKATVGQKKDMSGERRNISVKALSEILKMIFCLQPAPSTAIQPGIHPLLKHGDLLIRKVGMMNSQPFLSSPSRIPSPQS